MLRRSTSVTDRVEDIVEREMLQFSAHDYCFWLAEWLRRYSTYLQEFHYSPTKGKRFGHGQGLQSSQVFTSGVLGQ